MMPNQQVAELVCSRLFASGLFVECICALENNVLRSFRDMNMITASRTSDTSRKRELVFNFSSSQLIGISARKSASLITVAIAAKSRTQKAQSCIVLKLSTRIRMSLISSPSSRRTLIGSNAYRSRDTYRRYCCGKQLRERRLAARGTPLVERARARTAHLTLVASTNEQSSSQPAR